MSIIERFRLNFLYPELKDLNIDDQLLHQILLDKKFKVEYNKTIRTFIKSLKEIRKFDIDHADILKLDNDTIEQHLKNIFELLKYNNVDRYISFINDNFYHREKIKNFQVFNDDNFEEIYNLIGLNIFDDNISMIINKGFSERLIQFIKCNYRVVLSKLNFAIFEDKVWEIISHNPSIADTTILELFSDRIEVLVELINKNLFEGFKYTYENIPESHSFILDGLGLNGRVDQFSMDFINNVGDEALKKFYLSHRFSNDVEYKKMFQIASMGNYELIRDIAESEEVTFDFATIQECDMDKKLLEINFGLEFKKNFFLKKYLGISVKDIMYIKLFLESISKMSAIFLDDFKKSYGEILELLTKVFNSTSEELVEMSKSFELQKKESYTLLIKKMEKDGNELLKRQFASDLVEKHKKMISTIEPKSILTSNGKSLKVYEFTGQPFVMLGHAISDNTHSVNNNYVSEIINNPKNWEKIEDGNEFISTSIIFDKFMKTYGVPNDNKTVMYGFYNIPSEAIKYTWINDAGIDRNSPAKMEINMRNMLGPIVNTVTTIDNLMNKTIEHNLRKPPNGRSWTEIGLLRKDLSTGNKLKPDYIICMDKISEVSIKAAEFFDIPIYLIHRNAYSELPYINHENNLDNTTEMHHLKR